MKTLFERLKPEHKAKLELGAQKYPAIVKSIVDELKSNHAILCLSYGCIGLMTNELELPNSNLDTIMNLFEATENQEALKVKAEELLKVKI
jgi:hypothetical protein